MERKLWKIPQEGSQSGLAGRICQFKLVIHDTIRSTRPCTSHASLFPGDLVALQILETPEEEPSGHADYTRTVVALTGVSVTDASGKITVLTNPDFAVAANIDSSSSNQDLPQDAFARMSEGLGLSGNSNLPCSYARVI